MAVYFEDNFNGAVGTVLSSHVSDTGQAWTITNQTPANTPQLNGSGALRGALANANGYFVYDAHSATVASPPGGVTVTAEVDLTYPSGYAGFFGIGIFGGSGTLEFTVVYDQSNGEFITYIGVGPVGNIHVPGVVTNGVNTMSVALDFATNQVALVMNGNQFYYGPKAQSMSLPFGAYVAHTNGDTPAGSPRSIALFNRIVITDDIPTPTRFWTNLRNAQEQQ